MPYGDSCHPFVQNLVDELPGLVIGKMSSVAGHPRFEVLGIVPRPKHVDIVIGLYEQCVAPGVLFNHMISNDANVRQNAESDTMVVEYELCWFSCIMRNGHTVDLQIADLNACASHNFVDQSIRQFVYGRKSAISSKNWNVKVICKQPNATDMVAVLVGDKNGINILREHSTRSKLFDRAGTAEPAIDKNSGTTVLYDRAISLAAAT